MTQKKILEKAIQKAIDGGFKQNLLYLHGNVKDKNGAFMQWFRNLQDFVGNHIYYDYDEFICVPELIFNHDFAKALWGNKPYYRFDGDTLETPKQWQYHLQQMVISDDPIAYLGEHLD